MRHERVNILHISDLHYCSDRNHDHDVVIQAFQNDLRRLPSELKPDLIVFSGDLVHSGDSSDSYYCVLTRVLNPLLDITGLDEGRVFLVPGNHDVQRSAIVADETTQNGLECTLTDRITLNEYYLNASGCEYLRNKFYNFMTLKELLYNASVISADPYIESCYVRDINVALVALNTAWMSRAGLADRNDRSHLLFPEAAVQRALRSLPDTKAKILVGHHPLDWLADYSWQDLRRIFEREGLIYLHGHMHEPIAQNVRGTIGRCLAHQSGALFIDRDRYNGYAIISLDPESGHLEVNLRSYYERRGEFDVATNVVPEGRWYSSLEAEAFWSRLTPPFNGGDISRWLADRVRPELQARLDEGFSDRPLSEVFVPPRLSKRSPSSAISEDDELRDQQTCSMSDLVHGTENYLIVGKREYGKTTLLRQLALSLVNEHDTMPIAAVPCVVDFAEIKRGTNRFFALLRAQLPDTDGCNFTFSDVIKHGSLVVLVDDVNLADQTRRAVLLDFVKSNPTARFIFTTTPEP